MFTRVVFFFWSITRVVNNCLLLAKICFSYLRPDSFPVFSYNNYNYNYKNIILFLVFFLFFLIMILVQSIHCLYESLLGNLVGHF